MTKQRTRGFAVVACVAAACGACATAYHPQPSRRVALVVHGLGLDYVKEGRETAIGPFGGDLQSLVAGDEDAVRYARRARRELTVGVPAYLVGVTAIVVGLLVHKPEGWYVTGSGIAAAAVGLGLTGAGAVNAIDAVNVYNDRVSSRPP